MSDVKPWRSDDGEWIWHKDYEALQERIAQLTAERDAARRENECLVDEGLLLLNRIAELEAEISRLKQPEEKA